MFVLLLHKKAQPFEYSENGNEYRVFNSGFSKLTGIFLVPNRIIMSVHCTLYTVYCIRLSENEYESNERACDSPSVILMAGN